MAERNGPAERDAERRQERRRLDTEPRYATPFTVVGRIKSFRHAFSGLWFVLRSQHNAWLHAVATVLAMVLAALLGITVDEWCLLAIAITIVWVSETFNTGLEVLSDAVTSERHPTVKVAKDVAAAAVLLAALGATVVGAILFVPRLWEIIRPLFEGA